MSVDFNQSSYFFKEINNLLGSVLTVVDTLSAETPQSFAAKSLIRSQFKKTKENLTQCFGIPYAEPIPTNNAK